jgi:hypothetical protein
MCYPARVSVDGRSSRSAGDQACVPVNWANEGWNETVQQSLLTLW